MKFFSLNHFIIIISAFCGANLLTSETEWARYAGLMLMIYGLLIINHRVMEVLAAIGNKK